MTKLDKERKVIAERVKKFEQTTREIREMANTLHKKMEQLHLETAATRERARAARKPAEVTGTHARKTAKGRDRKVG